MTVRPLILSLLRERLSSFEEGETFRTLSSPVQTLVEACIDSAVKSLKILTALRDHSLLGTCLPWQGRANPVESFLPFDLENLFSASFVLSLISGILPGLLADHTYRDMGFSLLDEMIARSQVARMRKSEIELLEELMQPLQRQYTRGEPQSPKETAQRTYLETPLSQERESAIAPQVEVNPDAVALPDPAEDDLLFDWRDFGMSLNQMLSATDQLNANPSILDAEDGLQTDLWLWSDGRS